MTRPATSAASTVTCSVAQQVQGLELVEMRVNAAASSPTERCEKFSGAARAVTRMCPTVQAAASCIGRRARPGRARSTATLAARASTDR